MFLLLREPKTPGVIKQQKIKLGSPVKTQLIIYTHQHLTLVSFQ